MPRGSNRRPVPGRSGGASRGDEADVPETPPIRAELEQGACRRVSGVPGYAAVPRAPGAAPAVRRCDAAPERALRARPLTFVPCEPASARPSDASEPVPIRDPARRTRVPCQGDSSPDPRHSRTPSIVDFVADGATRPVAPRHHRRPSRRSFSSARPCSRTPSRREPRRVTAARGSRCRAARESPGAAAAAAARARSTRRRAPSPFRRKRS